MSPSSNNHIQVGSRLRSRRKALQLTLREVAEDAGVTEGYLSLVERGESNVSVATLQRVCGTLRLNVGELFASLGSSQGSAILRFSDTSKVAFGIDGWKVKLTPSQYDHLELLLGHFEPGGSTGVEPYTHGDSEELLLVLDGQVEVTIEGNTHFLNALDSIAYRSSQAHKVSEQTGRNRTRVLWAMSPPAY